MIREYGGYDKFDVEYSIPKDVNHFKEAAGDTLSEPISPSSLMVDIEGIHAFPHATRNYTRYMPECLKKSVPSWTKPYRRPLIKHHNEQDGEIIGRICGAEYITGKTFSGTPALKFTTNVPGEQAKKDVQDGLLETVSIGIIAHDVRCSICGHQIAEEGPCQDHDRGQVYGGEVCYWDIYSMEAKELSYVIVPSDIYAKNVCVYPATQSRPKTNITESADGVQGGGKKMNEKEIAELKEKLAAAEAAKAVAEAAQATAEAKVTALTEDKTNLEAKVTEVTEAKTALETKVAEMTEASTAVTEEVAREKQMREALEGEMATVKAEVKTNLVETVQAMRKAAGKPELEESTIKGRSEESLRDAINDLREEFKPALPAPGSVKSPGLAEKDEKNDGVDVKEQNTARNIDLQKGLEDLLNFVANAHK
jgi:FtsZ-binding cell division protein ZapB